MISYRLSTVETYIFDTLYDFRWRLPTTTWLWGTKLGTTTSTATGGLTTHSSLSVQVCHFREELLGSTHTMQEQHSTTRESTRIRRREVPSPSLPRRVFGLLDQLQKLFSLWSALASAPLTLKIMKRSTGLLQLFTINLKVLYQEENPGVEFEYSLKKDAMKETPSGDQ